MAEKGVLLSRSLAVRTKALVEASTPSPGKSTGPSMFAAVGGLLHPVELIDEWTNENEDDEDETNGWINRFRKLYFDPISEEYDVSEHDEAETEIYYPLSKGMRPPGIKGDRAFAVYRGRWEIIAFGEGGSDAKELFPAIVYGRTEYEKDDEEKTTEEKRTYVICPGGRAERSLSTVHVLNIEERKVSTSTFGALPKAMCNFGAALLETDETSAIICAPGEIDSGTRYPVQRYDFDQGDWTKTDGEQQLIGCPAFAKDGTITVVGGQSAYYVSAPMQTKAVTSSGGLAMYGHVVTCLWTIDVLTGELATRVPLRSLSNTSSSAQLTSYIVNEEKRFLKQNFSGIPYDDIVSEKKVAFIAVGGMELLGYDAKAVVAYTLDSVGAPIPIKDLFPETPEPLGECGVVRIRKMKGKDCDLLVCIGGRYKTTVDEVIELPDGTTKTVERTVFETHKKPWSLNLENLEEGWKNNLFPEIPTPRWNAGLSDVATTLDPVINEATGKPTGQMKEVDRVFLIGGRNKNGLLLSIEALNLSEMKWETDWPGLDNRIPKTEKNKEQK